MSEIQRGQAGS